MKSVEKRKRRPSLGEGRRTGKHERRITAQVCESKAESITRDWSAWLGFLDAGRLAAAASGDVAATAAWTEQYEVALSAWSEAEVAV